MSRFRPRLTGVFAVLTVLATVPTAAQENLDSGKSGAQLFASDCAICHKTPQSLKHAGAPNLVDFLRQHYAASRESATAIAAYLGRSLAAPARAIKQSAKGDGTKGSEKNPAAGKPSAPMARDAKSGGAKSSEPKASEPNPSEPKADDAKPSEPKPADGVKPE